MQTKPTPATKAAELREFAALPEQRPIMTALYRRAEAELRKRQKHQGARAAARRSEAEPERLLHELEVHQIELEIQNSELRLARDNLEMSLENYTDLYDFAPVGYFTLAADGRIHQANLTGAHLVGSDRSRLVGQSFGLLVSAEQRPGFHSFLQQVFADQTKRSSDFELLHKDRPPQAVNIEAQRLPSGLECRAAVMDITDRKQVEAASAQLAAIVKFSSDAIIGRDLNGIVTSWNAGAESIFGYSADEMVGRPILRLIPSDRLHEEAQIMSRIKKGENVEHFETMRVAKDGRRLDVSLTVSPIKDATGKIAGASKVARDITDRKRAEDDVRVSEVRYRRLFEAAHDGVLLLDPGTRKITDANPFMTKLLGYRHNQLVGKELFEIGLLKDEVASQEMFRRLKRKHEVRYEDLPLESRTGRHQEVEVVANLYQENGHTVIQCNIRDITMRKQAEQALRASEERYRNLFDVGPAAVYSCDASGVIQEFNRRAAELWRREPALGDTDERFCGSFKLFRPDGSFVPHEQCPMAEVISGKIPAARDAEVLIERPDGSQITVVVNIRPLKNEREEITGAINCFYDISERKQAEETLRRNEALFSALVSQSPVGVYVVDSRLRLQQVNPTAQPAFKKVRRLVGRDLSEIIRVLWPRRVADQILQRFRHTLKTGVPYVSSDFAERRRDIGVEEHYEWQIQRVTLPAGEYGVVCFFTNITGRKKAEAAERRLEVLAASNRKLEQEIVRRRVVEKSLKQSEEHKSLLLDQSRHMQGRLRHLSHQILRVQEEERKRISRELHDVIAQTLTSVNIQLATLKKDAALNPKGLERNIARTQQLVERSVNIVHQFARELRPAALDDLGLIPALDTFMKRFGSETGLRVRLSAAAKVEPMDGEKRSVLYRVAQEALTNIARHAQARRADVKIWKSGDAMCMTIKDDGKGFEMERVLHGKKKSRLGFLGMRERVEMVRGNFTVRSTPGKGTAVQVQIPLTEVRGGGKDPS